jgi:hypothetical protein
MHKRGSTAIAVLSCKYEGYYVGIPLICSVASSDVPHFEVDVLPQISAENHFARLVLVKPGENTPAWVCRPCFRNIPPGATDVEWQDIYISHNSTDLVYEGRMVTCLPVIRRSLIDALYRYGFTPIQSGSEAQLSSDCRTYFTPFPVSYETFEPLLLPGEHAVTLTFTHTNRDVITGNPEIFHVCLRMQGPSCSDLTVTAAINDFWDPSEVIQSRTLAWSRPVHTWKTSVSTWKNDSGEKAISIEFTPIEVRMPGRSEDSVICQLMRIYFSGSWNNLLSFSPPYTSRSPVGSLPEMLYYRDGVFQGTRQMSEI